MTNEDIKKLADELSFNVGWENIRVLVTVPPELMMQQDVEIDPAFKDQVLDWLKGNGTEPSILCCGGVKVEVFGITDLPPHVVRMLPHDETGTG
jgi:hypothetical protein